MSFLVLLIPNNIQSIERKGIAMREPITPPQSTHK
jgi:hypothetical protein